MGLFEDVFSPVTSTVNSLTGGLGSALNLGGMFDNFMGKPDYDPALKAQQAAFEEEKKRRAMEANRTDLQASQAARLFFGGSTTNPKSDMTNDFLGL